ncbi:class I SAM-dependent methyltransferase [Echinicola soli]|uniref:Class I SAM-dependent methyltransferase n=1 Tax=Echinicola soli TaxID=2591634 RepID=A0A514CJ46_9BACT|nr:class I SAM-dependent methyltransferase [Echinicola soli]QDH79806.1 class I SAM-dependent methyltransferase [Echinicola soli]
MKKKVVNLIRALFPKLYSRFNLYNRLIHQKNSFIYETGWVYSIQIRGVINDLGDPIPWMNYSFIEFIKNRLSPSMDVFEYGSGYSTIFFSKYVKSIISVEYDKEWYDRIKPLVPLNSTVIYRSLDTNYVSSIRIFKKSFNIIIIDGRRRNDCLITCLESLNENGVVIFDDSFRSRYQESFALMNKMGFRWLDFYGFKPGAYKMAQTTVFYRDNNCLEI